MFEGNIFFADTGTPSLKIAFANKLLADAEPEPLMLANRITKSFVAFIV
jgi:hypothetical protein